MSEVTSFVERPIQARTLSSTPDMTPTEKLVSFPRRDGSRIPYEVYSSPEIYDLEEERIFRGPTWSFVALDVELPKPGDFKSTFVGATPAPIRFRILAGGAQVDDRLMKDSIKAGATNTKERSTTPRAFRHC